MKDIEYKSIVIADAIAGAHLYFTEDTFFYGFVDYLMIFLGEASVITLWKKNGTHNESLLWCSAPKASIEENQSINRIPGQHGITIGTSDYEIVAFNWPTSDEENFVFDADKTTSLHVLFNELQENVSREILNSVAISAKTVIESSENFSHNSGGGKRFISPKLMKQYFKPMRRAIDEIIETTLWEHNIEFTTYKNESIPIKNLFYAVSYFGNDKDRYNDRYPYTARMLLPKQTKMQLRQRSNDTAWTNKLIDDIEHPLGLNERSIADIVLQSSIVDFGKRPGGHLDKAQSNNQKATARRSAESHIYPDGKNSTICMFPVTVGCGPWLALYTFSGTAEADTPFDKWLHHYRFYRDVLHTTAWRIREAAISVYPRVISSHIEDKVGTKPTINLDLITKINKTLRELAQIYPFHLLQLKEVNKITAFSLKKDDIEVKANPFFASQNLNWDSSFTKTDWIHEAILNSLRKILLNNNTAQLVAFSETSHTLNVPLLSLQSKIALLRSDQLDDARGHIVSQIKGIRALSEVTRSLSAKHYDFEKLCQKYRVKVNLTSFTSLLNTYIVDSLYAFSVPPVQRSLKDRVERLFGNSDSLIFSKTPLSFSIENKQSKVVYFEGLPEIVTHELIQNAIKHCADEKNEFVTIDLEFDPNKRALYIVVKNHINQESDEMSSIDLKLSAANSSNIGLGSIQLYHDAYYYDEKATLTYSIEKLDESCTTQLTIKAMVGKIYD